MDWPEVLAKYGIATLFAIVFLIFFIKNWKKMSDRITEIENYQRETLQGLVVDATAAITKSTEVSQKLIDTTTEFQTEIMKRSAITDHI